MDQISNRRRSSTRALVQVAQRQRHRRHDRRSAFHALPVLPALLAAVVVAGLPSLAWSQDGAPEGSRTQLVLLGTGTPNHDPLRWGPATAVIVDDQVYLVDAGPGVVRRAAAARAKGIEALVPRSLTRVFLTHLHSDHTVGLPDLMHSPWVEGRAEPLQVYGPSGTRRMTGHLEEAWMEDVHMRLFGLEPQSSAVGYQAATTEVEPGLFYDDGLVRISAIPVVHGSWPEAYGYKFETPDRTIVISGDAMPSPGLAEACDGCDILVHEVYSQSGFETRPPVWQRYHSSFHTSTVELAELAKEARPGILVLYHQLFWGSTPEDLVREIREAGYEGVVVSGEDLDVY